MRTDMAGLIAFLNGNAELIPTPAALIPPVSPEPPIASSLAPTVEPKALDAAGVLARIDLPSLSIDAIVEGIAATKGGYALKRVAGAVAIRLEEPSR